TAGNNEIGVASFATHCDWIGSDPSDSTDGYLKVYDVPVPDFEAAKALGGDPVSDMGDDAFILTEGNEPTVYVRSGDRAVATSRPHLNTWSGTDAIPPYGPEDELKIGAIIADRLAAAASGALPSPVETQAPSSPVAWVPVEPDAVYDVPNAQ